MRLLLETDHGRGRGLHAGPAPSFIVLSHTIYSLSLKSLSNDSPLQISQEDDAPSADEDILGARVSLSLHGHQGLAFHESIIGPSFSRSESRNVRELNGSCLGTQVAKVVRSTE